MTLSMFPPTQVKDKENKHWPVKCERANAGPVVNALIGDSTYREISPLSKWNPASVTHLDSKNVFINMTPLRHKHVAEDRCSPTEMILCGEVKATVERNCTGVISKHIF